MKENTKSIWLEIGGKLYILINHHVEYTSIKHDAINEAFYLEAYFVLVAPTFLS